MAERELIAEDCLEFYTGECVGPVRWRASRTGTGVSMKRCDPHDDAAAERARGIRAVYPDSPNPPAWFDPMMAGETWNED